MDVLGLADDLTGALEVGAKFAGRGIDAIVTTRKSGGSKRVLVIDTETRHVAAAEAARQIAMAVAGSDARLIYKKTDSTLRGNIGAELGALLAAFPESPLIYAPAYPAMGRLVKRGQLYVDGSLAHETLFAKDELNPVSDSDIARMIRSQTQAPTFSTRAAGLNNLKPGTIYVCDGETDADVAEAACALTAGMCRLAAGPAAFAEAIAEGIHLPRDPLRPWPTIRSCLVINGSRHELSRQQVCHAEKLGWRMADTNSIPYSEWVILDASGDAAATGELLRNILERVKLDALTIFGGDTTYGILTALGNPPLCPLGEIVPGVPISKIAGADLHLITKAGGFGPVDVLCAIRRALP